MYDIKNDLNNTLNYNKVFADERTKRKNLEVIKYAIH